MKKNIIILGLILLGLTSCNDFLDVNSDSKYQDDFVFASMSETNRALSGVYASILSSSTYGNNYMSTFALNSDVEFTPNSSSIRTADGRSYKWFDCTSSGSDLSSTWSTAYQGIERANTVINGIKKSPIFNPQNADLMQMLGEARVLRAMQYYDLVVLFGDIPFRMTNTFSVDTLFTPIVDRNTILDSLINDLKDASKSMKYASAMTDGVERASKEFCQSLIARMALTRGGYSLYPDVTNPLATGMMLRPGDYLDYYKIAMQYADSVISSGKHSLKKSFRDVFIDECNYTVSNDDDPIFEIPFLVNGNGNVGYLQGPSGSTGNNGSTGINVWGGSSGSVKLNAFYRFSFDRSDLRLDYTVGMWSYAADGTPAIYSNYSTFCNKWSKFWTSSTKALGVTSTGSTGINYPYMRYADVLLMYAEAVNEVEGGVTGAHGTKAIEAFRQVRKRAFSAADQSVKVEKYITDNTASKEAFFNAIANERKWEFGGENMRWKDLVRWDMYSKVVYDCFKQYWIVGNYAKGNYLDGSSEYDNLPFTMFYKKVDNPGLTSVYPNTKLPILEIYNPYNVTLTNPGTTYTAQNFYEWGGSAESELPNDYCLYSFRGYVRMGVEANYESLSQDNLPPFQSILPLQKSVIHLPTPRYTNYYGYN